MGDKYTPDEMELLRQRTEMECEARKEIHEAWSGAFVWVVGLTGLFSYLVWGKS